MDYPQLYHKSHIMTMKVALAVVIIRQKPKSLSAYSYTQQLAKQLQEGEVEWKKRARGLEEEVLLTKQELVRCQLQASLTSNGAATTQSVLDSLPCGMEWQASTIYPTHYLPAACRIGADVGGGVSTCEDLALATRNTAQGGTRSVKARECGAHESVRSHVPQGGTRSVKARECGAHESVRSHVLFLMSSLVGFHQKLPPVLNAELVGVVSDTLMDTMKGLRESLTDSWKWSEDSSHKNTISTAVALIADMVVLPSLSCVQGELSESLLELALLLLQQERLCKELLLSMCNVRSVLVGVVRELVRLLISSVQKLPSFSPSSFTSRPDVHPLPDNPLPNNSSGYRVEVQVIDSMERQMSLLEALLAQYDVTKNMETQECFSLASDLEEVVIERCLAFPLVTYGLWRIISQLSR